MSLLFEEPKMWGRGEREKGVRPLQVHNVWGAARGHVFVFDHRDWYRVYAFEIFHNISDQVWDQSM